VIGWSYSQGGIGVCMDRSVPRNPAVKRKICTIYTRTNRIDAPCGSGSCRIDPLRFLAGWRKRRLNQVLVSFGLVCVYVCSFYRLFRFF